MTYGVHMSREGMLFSVFSVNIKILRQEPGCYVQKIIKLLKRSKKGDFYNASDYIFSVWI